MHIEIAERLKPFSHLPGIFFVLPGTSYRLQIFPACFRIDDLSGATPAFIAQINMDIQGPLDQFTVEQDLEKGLIRIWGISSAGFFRYCLKAITEGSGIMMFIEKVPPQGVPFQCTGLWSLENSQPLQAGDKRLLAPFSQFKNDSIQYKIPLIDRLSLGNHKSQDWELMRRRRNLAEIFPVWHRLGQLIPKQIGTSSLGTLDLFQHCQQAIAASSPEHILTHFENVFLTGFDGGLSPRLIDSDFHGILKNSNILMEKVSPLQLLTQGAELIRSLFAQFHEGFITLLPACPPAFHCGRLINTTCGDLGIVSIEWTKKSMRCMSFIATSSQIITISSSDGQRICRMRKSFKDSGVTYQLGAPISVTAGQSYWFDNFIS